VKEKRITVIQGNFPAWIGLYGSWNDTGKEFGTDVDVPKTKQETQGQEEA
jgi:hypothetical protein